MPKPLLKNNVPESTKNRARQSVYKAIAKGWLSPINETPCLDCGQSRACDYHHESYDEDRWLDVAPLCRHCHLTRHWGNYRQSITQPTYHKHSVPQFPDVEKKRVCIYVPVDLIPAIKEGAEKNNMSLSDLWCKAVQMWLEANQGQTSPISAP